MSSDITKSKSALSAAQYQDYDMIHANIPKSMFAEAGLEPDLKLAETIVNKFVMPNFVDFRLSKVAFNRAGDVCVVIQRKTNFNLHGRQLVAYIGAPQGLALQLQQLKLNQSY